MLVITSNRYIVISTSSMIFNSLILFLFSLCFIINMSSLIAQLVWILICYEMKVNVWFDSLAIIFLLDNIWSMNLDRWLDEVNIYLDLNYESFSLLLLTNILFYEGSTMFDCSLLIGNQINTLLSGLMVVFTLYYMVARHLYLIFVSIFL